MKVMKFGGSSVGSAEAIRRTCDLIASRAKPGDVIIESAVGTDAKAGKTTKVTDMLIECCKSDSRQKRNQKVDEIKNRHYEILDELGLSKNIIAPELQELESIARARNLAHKSKPSLKTLDHFQSLGERMSVKMVAAQLSKMGLGAGSVEAYRAGMITDSNYGGAMPLSNSYGKIRNALAKMNEILVIVTGFIGQDVDGNITTLGRGGSDYSAAIFAAAMGAERLELWTDVNGIKSANPKIVPKAHTIKHMSFDEAKELSFYGAKLHPKTIWPAMHENIPVHILNTFDPDGEFSVITNEREVRETVVKGITCNSGNCMITINSPKMIEEHGFLARIFDAFVVNATAVDMVSTSEAGVSLTIKDTRLLDAILKDLETLKDTSAKAEDKEEMPVKAEGREEMSVKVEKNKSIICVVGEGMKHTPGTSGRLFSALGKAGINVQAIAQGASEINITFVVNDDDANYAINVAHAEFFK